MIKLNKLILLMSMLMLMMIITVNIDYSENSDDLSVDLMGMKAQAQASLPGQGDCTSFGYRNWDHANPLKSSGYDCLCQARQKVANDCE